MCSAATVPIIENLESSYPNSVSDCALDDSDTSDTSDTLFFKKSPLDLIS